MSLDCVWLNRNDLDECVQSNVSDVVITVRQELSKNVDTEHAKTRIRFYVQDG
jgi:hypothetical protein